MKAAAGSSPADPEPATQQQAGRGSCPAAEPSRGPQQREAAGWVGSARDQESLQAGILLLSRFREAGKRREGPHQPSDPQRRGGSLRSAPAQSQFGGGQRRSQWSLPDLDLNTGYPCGWGQSLGGSCTPPPRTALVTPCCRRGPGSPRQAH